MAKTPMKKTEEQFFWNICVRPGLFPQFTEILSDDKTGFSIWKTILTHLVTKFRGFRHAKNCTPPTKKAYGGMRWLFLLEHYSFFFLLQWNVQTIIKVELSRLRKFLPN